MEELASTRWMQLTLICYSSCNTTTSLTSNVFVKFFSHFAFQILEFFSLLSLSLSLPFWVYSFSSITPPFSPLSLQNQSSKCNFQIWLDEWFQVQHKTYLICTFYCGIFNLDPRTSKCTVLEVIFFGCTLSLQVIFPVAIAQQSNRKPQVLFIFHRQFLFSRFQWKEKLFFGLFLSVCFSSSVSEHISALYQQFFCFSASIRMVWSILHIADFNDAAVNGSGVLTNTIFCLLFITPQFILSIVSTYILLLFV